MSLKVEKKVSLKDYTTLKVGGEADCLVKVSNKDELIESIGFAEESSLPILLLGSGSNVLVNDQGFRGLVILNQIKGINYKEEKDCVFLECGAGEILDEVIAVTVDKGYWGLENLSAIPGTIGATPVQNVGAYGVEVSDLIESVEAVSSEDKTVKVFSNNECKFGYRDSFFKTESGRQWIITKVVFKLSKTSTPILTYKDLKEVSKQKNLTQSDIRNEVIKIRSTKFPDWTKVGTAGSFFKNPIIDNEEYESLKEKYPDLPGYPVGENKTKVSLGWILDNVCDLRGFCRDGVCLYKNQALVLVNESATSATVINEFANFVADTVKEKTSIKIEREVRSV